MVRIDRDMERRVWQRVYGKQQPQKQVDKKVLEQCYRREMANFTFYDRNREDPVYGAAFTRLAQDAQEHCKMLQQIRNG